MLLLFQLGVCFFSHIIQKKKENATILTTEVYVSEACVTRPLVRDWGMKCHTRICKSCNTKESRERTNQSISQTILIKDKFMTNIIIIVLL